MLAHVPRARIGRRRCRRCRSRRTGTMGPIGVCTATGYPGMPSPPLALAPRDPTTGMLGSHSAVRLRT